jgi:hypothetical protein
MEGSVEMRRSQIFDRRVEESFSLSSSETFQSGVVNKLERDQQVEVCMTQYDDGLLDCLRFFRCRLKDIEGVGRL